MSRAEEVEREEAATMTKNDLLAAWEGGTPAVILPRRPPEGMAVIGYLHQTESEGPPRRDWHVNRPWTRNVVYPEPLCSHCVPVWQMVEHPPLTREAR